VLRRPIPLNLVDAAFHKAVNPLSYKDKRNRWNERTWKRAVGITCALSRKYYFDKGDEHPMELDENDRDRSYLYGRLLAVADKLEEEAQKQVESSRITNAMRYMQRFQQRPADTWKMLRSERLGPYYKKLPPDRRNWYSWQITQLENKFIPGEIELAVPLGVRFLEGYSNQKAYRPAKPKTDVSNTDNTNKEE